MNTVSNETMGGKQSTPAKQTMSNKRSSTVAREAPKKSTLAMVALPIFLNCELSNDARRPNQGHER
jgi:hypothetical protein